MRVRNRPRMCKIALKFALYSASLVHFCLFLMSSPLFSWSYLCKMKVSSCHHLKTLWVKTLWWLLVFSCPMRPWAVWSHLLLSSHPLYPVDWPGLGQGIKSFLCQVHFLLSGTHLPFSSPYLLSFSFWLSTDSSEMFS